MERRYSSKFFRIYVPQVHETQTDFCLYARKRLNKHKYRFRCGVCVTITHRLYHGAD